MKKLHIPVLVKECMELLLTDTSGIYFDGTIGFGGHAANLLNHLDQNAMLIGTDVDNTAFQYSMEKFRGDQRVKLYNYNFSQIDLIAKIEGIDNFNGIFADLGVSSYQLDNPSSGFTYRNEAELDLRLDKKITVKASDVINTYSESDLAEIFYEYGEEKRSRRVAHEIIQRRGKSKIIQTTELAEIVASITPFEHRISTLSRIFQALRVYINDELGVLKLFLAKAFDQLKKKGRIVILTYHSLEDRIVKEAFRYETLSCICPKDFPICKCEKEKRLKILTRRPITPSDEEIKNNVRSRSAKLRAAERI